MPAPLLLSQPGGIKFILEYMQKGLQQKASLLVTGANMTYNQSQEKQNSSLGFFGIISLLEIRKE